MQIEDELRPIGFHLFGAWTTKRGQASAGEGRTDVPGLPSKEGPAPRIQSGRIAPRVGRERRRITYEVKLDRKVQETGNVYVERKSLFNSKADYLVYLFHVAHADPRVYFIFIAQAAKVRNRLRGKSGIVGGISRNQDGS